MEPTEKRRERMHETAKRYANYWSGIGAGVGVARTAGTMYMNRALGSPLKRRDIAVVALRRAGKGALAGAAGGAVLGAVRNKLGPTKEKVDWK